MEALHAELRDVGTNQTGLYIYRVMYSSGTPTGLFSRQLVFKNSPIFGFQKSKQVVKNKYVASESDNETQSTGCYSRSELTYRNLFLLCSLFQWLVHKSLPN